MPLPTKSALVLIGWLADQDESTLLQVASLRGLKPSECESLAEMSQALLGEVNTLATLRDDTELPPIQGTWLVTRVAFHRSREGGTTTRLRLVPVGAIRVFPTEAA